MASEHDRFEELAVGHVLGGLATSEAAEFRSHLTGCRDCRARVSELRDIASDLAAAEREELAQTRLKIDVARRELAPAVPDPAWSVSLRAVTLTLGVAVLLVVGLAFWNFHLRDQNAQLARVTDHRETILEGLAVGQQVPTELSGGVTGVVVVVGEDVVLDLAGLPELAADEMLVVWLLGDEPTDHYWMRFGPDDLSRGRLAVRDPHRGTATLVVTLEDGPPGEEPTGDRLVEAQLRVSRSSSK